MRSLAVFHVDGDLKMSLQPEGLDGSVVEPGLNFHYGNRRILFLFGPTAVGKTALLRDFFSDGFEVVNADSVQVYRGLDIGSAKKPLPESPRHHLIDILEPDEAFNVASFIRLADEACRDILSRGLTPVLSGGTAYYFKHFLYGLSEAPEVDPDVRASVGQWMKSLGNGREAREAAHARLAEVDPVSAARINVNDVYRITRAIEVYLQTGLPLSSFALPSAPRGGMKPLVIGLYREKEDLSSRIRLRVDEMFRMGLTEEIRRLLAAGASSRWQSMGAIGYREFIEALEADSGDSDIPEGGAMSCGSGEEVSGEAFEDPGVKRRLSRFDALSDSDLEGIKDKIVLDSIHYAKRQLTFFRSFKLVHWVHPDAFGDFAETYLF